HRRRLSARAASLCPLSNHRLSARDPHPAAQPDHALHRSGTARHAGRGGELMLLGKVIGTVVPALAYEGLQGVPMLWIQPLDKSGNAKGEPLVAADATRMAGPLELVYYEGGREAALLLEPWFVPVDHAIVGIVDERYTEES